MKTLKPLHILFIGSSVVTTVGLIIVLLCKNYGLTDPIHIVLSLLAVFLTCFFIFYFLIKRFIDERLKILYRSIRKGKFVKSSNSGYSFLKKDIIEQTETQAKDWTDERINEISRLKEQEAFRRDFLGNLAHELKTPIFAIQGYILTLLEGGLEDESVNTLFLERASKATDRMVNLLEDLDQITRLEVEGLNIKKQSFDIIELVEEIIDNLSFKAGEKDIELSLAKNYPATNVHADRNKIAQVLTNLINNSIYYGKESGQTLVRIYQLDNIVTVEVADDGPGIAEEHISRLFERFYRVEKSRARNAGGSGLGLAIVKHIIESHGQSINVRSTVDVGSTFAFTLEKSK